jgi:hypothetical protein
MSKREPVHDRYKGQVYGQDAVSAAPGEVAARIEATQGSERLLAALFRYNARLRRERLI